jgi:hypothetical protein
VRTVPEGTAGLSRRRPGQQGGRPRGRKGSRALTFIGESPSRTLPTGIYAPISGECYGNYPILRAALVVFSLPVLVLFFVFQQQFIEGLTAGALKQ